MVRTTQAAEPIAPIDFDAVYEREFSYVWRTLRRLGVRDADIEDVAHDVFIVVHRRLSDYDPNRPLRPWLFGIALRTASTYRRDRARGREVPEPLEDPVDPSRDAEELAAASEARRIVYRALAELDLEQRAVFILHDLDGHTMPSIAESLGILLNTAYSRLRYARAKFTAYVRRLQLRGTP